MNNINELLLIERPDVVAIADAIRVKTGKTEELTLAQMPIEIGNIQSGVSAPDGMNVAFGNIDGVPVECEEAYVISSIALNELGAVIQKMAGKNTLMTAEDMIYWLNRVQFIPQGHASSEYLFNTYSNALGILPVVVSATINSGLTLNFESSAIGALQEA